MQFETTSAKWKPVRLAMKMYLNLQNAVNSRSLWNKCIVINRHKFQDVRHNTLTCRFHRCILIDKELKVIGAALKNLSFRSMFLVLMLAGIGSFIGNILSQNDPQPLQLNASTISNDGNVSLSTGLINKNSNGLYILDHDTGDLKCWMIARHSGQITGTFRTNVFDDMQFTKAGNSKLLMIVNYAVKPTAGKVQETGNRSGMSTCFVAESISGKIITYRVAYDPKALVSGRNQSGKLEAISKTIFRDKE